MMKAHTGLEGKGAVSEALEIEAYQLDAEAFEAHQIMDSFNETLQENEDQVAEHYEQIANIENFIVDLTK